MNAKQLQEENERLQEQVDEFIAERTVREKIVRWDGGAIPEFDAMDMIALQRIIARAS